MYYVGPSYVYVIFHLFQTDFSLFFLLNKYILWRTSFKKFTWIVVYLPYINCLGT